MDIRQQVTNSIIEAIEKGTLPWRKSWQSDSVPFNMSSGKKYSGINVLLLAMQPFEDPRFLTEKQAEYMGLRIHEDAMATSIVRMVEVNRKKKSEVNSSSSEVLAEDDAKALVMRTYRVFNASQIDGIEPLPKRPCNVTCSEAVDGIIQGLQKTGLKVNFGQGFEPAYRPRTDEVRMPPASAFKSIDDFHSVLLHEAAGHGSQHPKRLAMMHTDIPNFGSAEYSRLELIAELTSAQLSAQLGLPISQSLMDSHASYISSWLQVLKNDKTEIFKAANAAQKICDYVSNLALDIQEFKPHATKTVKPTAEPEKMLPLQSAKKLRR